MSHKVDSIEVNEIKEENKTFLKSEKKKEIKFLIIMIREICYIHIHVSMKLYQIIQLKYLQMK